MNKEKIDVTATLPYWWRSKRVKREIKEVVRAFIYRADQEGLISTRLGGDLTDLLNEVFPPE